MNGVVRVVPQSNPIFTFYLSYQEMISFSVKKANSKTISLTYIFIDPNVFFFKNFRYVISGLHNQKTAIFMRAKES